MLITIFGIELLSPYPIQMRENVIRNDCEFEIIRFKRDEVDCFDYGKNVRYCNHYAMPNEYVVTKEKGINLKEVNTIKPDFLYKKTDYNKLKLADFYYEFTCNKIDSDPKLLLNIVPVNDNSALISCLYFIGLLLLFMIMMIVLLVNEKKNMQKGYIYEYDKNK